MAHGMGLAGNSRICVLPRRSPDPGIDHIDEAFLHSPPMAYSFTVLGVDVIHYNHEHHRGKVSAQIRRIDSYNTHSGLLCYSPAVGDLRVASACFRSLQNLPQHRKLAYTRPLIYDRTYRICLYFYGYVCYPICL